MFISDPRKVCVLCQLPAITFPWDNIDMLWLVPETWGHVSFSGYEISTDTVFCHPWVSTMR